MWKKSCFSCPLKTNVTALWVIRLGWLTGNTFGSCKLFLWHKTSSLQVMAITFLKVLPPSLSLSKHSGFMDTSQLKSQCGQWSDQILVCHINFFIVFLLNIRYGPVIIEFTATIYETNSTNYLERITHLWISSSRWFSNCVNICNNKPLWRELTLKQKREKRKSTSGNGSKLLIKQQDSHHISFSYSWKTFIKELIQSVQMHCKAQCSSQAG